MKEVSDNANNYKCVKTERVNVQVTEVELLKYIFRLG